MSLVNRAKGILLNPKAEWPVIDTEPATVGSLYTGYIIPLAAIPAVASVLGLSVIGISGFQFPMSWTLKWAIGWYVLSLAMVFALALVIDLIAPSFSAQKNQIQALKVAAYGSTASWVAGVLLLIPSLGDLYYIVSLYSLFLLFLGGPILMRPPKDKEVVYGAVVAIAGAVLFGVLRVLHREIVGFPVPFLMP